MDDKKLYGEPISERDLSTAFKMGLRTAVYLLEDAENLSTKGRKYLIECLKIMTDEGIAEASDQKLRAFQTIR